MRQITLFAAAILVAGSAFAQSSEDALEARHGFMKMISIEMGTLSGMAKGEVAYDETAASASAANLMALTQYDAPKLFIEGTSSEDLEGSDALPAIWANRDDFNSKFAALREATSGIDEAVAGGGRAASDRLFSSWALPAATAISPIASIAKGRYWLTLRHQGLLPPVAAYGRSFWRPSSGTG